MRIKTSTGRKLRYGSTSLAITALIIAGVIFINAIMSLLTQRFMWEGDMTPEFRFTISQKCFDLIGKKDDTDDMQTPVEKVDALRAEYKKYNETNKLKEGDSGYLDENVKINILFPVEKDALDSDDYTFYVKENAEELRAKFPDYINVEYVNAIEQPKRFEKYLSSTIDKISLTSVIIECGSVYKIRTLNSFFKFVNSEPYAYDGEKAFASSILAVTRSKMPLACVITNHEESFPISQEVDAEGNNIVPFRDTLENAGYQIQEIDLSTEEIPADCSLLISFNPRYDFTSGSNGLEKDGELKKLDEYLDNEKAFMVFLDSSTTGKLENLEEFLAEWGLKVKRDDNKKPIVVRDPQHSELNNSDSFKVKYDVNDLMDGLAENLSATVIFEDALALDYAIEEGFKVNTEILYSDGTTQFEVASGVVNGQSRTVFPLFETYETAKGYSQGFTEGEQSVVNATEKDPLKLMAVSVQTQYDQETGDSVMPNSSYVVLCGSTDFASDKYINSDSYGNEDFLLSLFELCGREPVPVGLTYKAFRNYKIEAISSTQATAITVTLTVVPVVIALCAGVFVLVRRKHR